MSACQCGPDGCGQECPSKRGEVLDLFCGAGGASVGLSLLGYDVVGVDNDADALATHEAAGHATVRADLTRPVAVLPGRFVGVWASPPCTAFSTAGKRQGHDLADELIRRVDLEDWSPMDAPPPVWLVLPTMKAILQAAPEWVVMENVTSTRPVMEACARVLRRRGYTATVITLQAERYGVAQTRKRAFLVATMADVDEADLTPAPTHREYVHARYHRKMERVARDQAHLEPWVSMADALGWGQGDAVGFQRKDDLGTSPTGYRERDMRPASEPAFSMTEKIRSAVRYRTTPMANSADHSPDEPAPTVAFGHEIPKWHFDRRQVDANGPVPLVSLDRPAPTLTWGKGTQVWRDAENEIVRITVAEAARLQAFPTDHPWQGSKTSQFRQIGNAVPPPLAAAVAGAASGRRWRDPVARYLTTLYSEGIDR